MEKLKLDIQFFAVQTAVEFNIDISDMKKQLSILKNEVNANEQTWLQFAAATKDWANSGNNINKRIENLNTSLEMQQKEVDLLEEKYGKWQGKLDAANPSLSALALQLEKARTSMAKTKAEIDSHQSKITKVGKEWKTLEEIVGDFDSGIAIANAQFSKSTAGMEDWSKSTEGLKAKLTQLNSVYEIQGQKIDYLQKEYQKLVNAKQESSDEGKKLLIQLTNEQAVLAKTALEITKNTDSLNKIETNYKTLDELIGGFNDDIKLANLSFAKATAGMDDWASSSEGLKAKLTQINDISELQGRKVDLLQKEYDKLVDAKQENTQEGKKLLAQLTNEQIALSKNEKELKNYSSETANAKAKLGDLSRKIESLTKEYKDLEKQEGDNKDSLKKIQSEIDKTTKEYKDLEKEIGDVDDANLDMKKSTNDVRDGFTVLKGVISNLISDGIRRLAGSMKDAAVEAAKTAMSFESSFTDIVKTVDATDQELNILKKDLMVLSTRVATPLDDINRVAALGGQLGIETPKLEKFTETMIKLGDATDMDASTAGSEIARLASITGMSQDDFDKLGSSLVSLGNNLPTTESEIMTMSMRLAAAGDTVGLTESEIVGLSAAMSSVGIEAEMGGTAISKALSKMNVASKTGMGKIDTILKNAGMSFRDLELMYSNNTTGFKKFAQSIGLTSTELSKMITSKRDLQNFAEIAGMTAEEFSKKFGEDAVGGFQAFIKGLGDTSNASEDAITMLQDMGITEVRLRDSLTRLANSNDLMTKSVEMSSDAWEKNVALTNEADRRYQTMESKIEMMKNQLRILAVSIFENFSEPAKEGIDTLKDAFAKLTREIKKPAMKDALKEIGKAIGEILKAFSELIVKVIPKLIKILGNLAKNWKTIAKTLSLVVSTVGAYIIAQKAWNIAAATGNKLMISGKVAAALYKAVTMLLTKATWAEVKAQWALNTAQLANPTGVLVGVVAALAAGFIYLAKKTNDAKKVETEYTKQVDAEIEKLEEVRTARDEDRKAIEERKDAQKEAISTGLSEMEHLEGLWKELQSITDENGKIKDGYKARADFIIGELNEALGTEIERNGDIIQGYKDIQEQIDKTIEKKKAMIILDAYEDDYRESVKNEVGKRKDISENDALLSNALKEEKQKDKEISDAYTARDKKIKELEKKYGTEQQYWNTSQQRGARAALKPFQDEIETKEIEKGKASKKVSEYSVEQKALQDDLNKIIETQVDYEVMSDEVLNGNYKKVIDKHSGLVKDWVNADNETIKKGTVEWLSQITSYNKKLDKALTEGDEKAIKLAELGIQEGNEQLKILAQTLGGQVTTIEEMSPEVQTAWQLLATNATGIYLTEMAKLSPEQQATLTELTGVTATEGVNITNEWAKIATDSLYALTGQQILFHDAGNGMVQMVIDGVKVGEPLAVGEMETLVTNMNEKISEGKAGATTATDNLIAGVGVSFGDKRKSVIDVLGKVGSFAGKVIERLSGIWKEHSPSKVTENMGINLLKGVSNGIDAEEKNVYKDINNFGKNAVNKLQNKLNSAKASLNTSIGLNSSSLNEIGQIQGKQGKTIIINQTNNSPRELSQLEIYRQTKNAAQLAART